MRLHSLYSKVKLLLKMRGARASRKLAAQDSRMRSNVRLLVTSASLWSGHRMATLRSRVIRKMVLMETKVHPANTGPISMQGCQGLSMSLKDADVPPWYHKGGALVTIREISVKTEKGTTTTPTIMSAMARDTANKIDKEKKHYLV